MMFVDLDPAKNEELKRMVREAKDPEAKKEALDALQDYQDLIRINKGKKPTSKPPNVIIEART